MKQELLQQIKENSDKKDAILALIKGHDILGKDNGLFELFLYISAACITITFSNHTFKGYLIAGMCSFGFVMILQLMIDLILNYIYFDSSYQLFMDFIEKTYGQDLNNGLLLIEPDQESLNGFILYVINNNKSIKSNFPKNLTDYESFNLSLNFIEKNLKNN